MDPQLKILNRLYFENIPTDKLIRILDNPVRAFEDEMIEGAFIDIGCGESSILLDYIGTDRELIAVDAEPSQLKLIQKRVEQYSPEKITFWKFIQKTLPDESIFDRDYALLIFSNILHFFTLAECIEIGKLIAHKTKTGSLIYSRVLSHKHYANNPEHPNSEDPFFKHFFSVEDLDKVFNNEKFERVYYADIEREITSLERKIQTKWIEEICRKAKITDRREITQIKRDHFRDQKESYIDTIYRRL